MVPDSGCLIHGARPLFAGQMNDTAQRSRKTRQSHPRTRSRRISGAVAVEFRGRASGDAAGNATGDATGDATGRCAQAFAEDGIPPGNTGRSTGPRDSIAARVQVGLGLGFAETAQQQAWVKTSLASEKQEANSFVSDCNEGPPESMPESNNGLCEPQRRLPPSDTNNKKRAFGAHQKSYQATGHLTQSRCLDH